MPYQQKPIELRNSSSQETEHPAPVGMKAPLIAHTEAGIRESIQAAFQAGSQQHNAMRAARWPLVRPFQLQIGADALSQIGLSGQYPRRLKLSPQTTNSKKNFELLSTEEQLVVETVQQAAGDIPPLELGSTLENLHLRTTELSVADEAPTSLESAKDLPEESTVKRKKKKEWTGPIRPKRHPPYPPWTESYCIEKQIGILDDLVANELGDKLAVSTVLDGWLGRVTRVDLANVMKELESQKRHFLLLEVFNWMRKCSGRLNPKAHVWNMVLGILGRAGMIDDAEELFRSVKETDWDKLRPYNAMIAAYYQARRPEDAWDLYQQMQAEGIDPDEVTFNTLLGGNSRSGIRVEGLFLQMKSCGLKPNLRSYNTVISALSKEGKIDMAENIIEEMNVARVQPDVFSFNSLIGAYSRARRPEKGLQVLKKMKALGVSPDIVTYTTLIQMFSRSSMHMEAIGIFREMEADECQPDFFTYSLLVNVYGKAGLVQEAAKVFKKLQLEGHKPNLVTWSSLMSAYLQQGLFEETHKQFTLMEACGIQADVQLFNMIMHAYSKAGLIAEAVNLFQRLRARGILPTRASYAILVEGFLSSGRLGEARAIYAAMVQAGFSDSNLSSRLSRAC